MKWAKSIFALVVAGLMAGYDFYNSGSHNLNPLEIVTVALAVFNAAAVWLVPNTTRWPWFKGGVSLVITILGIMVTVLNTSVGHTFNMPAVYQIIMMIAQTLGVASIPNTGEPLPATPVPVQSVDTTGQVAYADGTLGASESGSY